MQMLCSLNFTCDFSILLPWFGWAGSNLIFFIWVEDNPVYLNARFRGIKVNMTLKWQQKAILWSVLMYTMELSRMQKHICCRKIHFSYALLAGLIKTWIESRKTDSRNIKSKLQFIYFCANTYVWKYCITVQNMIETWHGKLGPKGGSLQKKLLMKSLTCVMFVLYFIVCSSKTRIFASGFQTMH
jgi:hypothetical protein